MGKIDRRELLKLGELAAAAAAVPRATLGANRKGKQAAYSNGLNVVIHGMSAVVIDRANNRISLMLPDAPGHSYGMGKFGS